jgi:hypothetical protein
MPGQGDFTGCGSCKTGDPAQGGCFSAATGPEKGDKFALFCLKVKVVYGDMICKLFVNMGKLNETHGNLTF